MVQFFIEVKKQILGVSLGALITAAITVTAFYFNTNSTLKAHTNDIEIIKTDVRSLNNKVSDINLKPARMEEQINNFEKQMNEMTVKIDKNNERMDKIYEILLSIKNGKH